MLRKFDQETVELVPDLIIMESETELTQYFIKEWSLEYKDRGGWWDHDLQGGGEQTDSEPDLQQGVPVHLPDTLVPFWYPGMYDVI